jgi:predicted site-specific integrase-resolvase
MFNCVDCNKPYYEPPDALRYLGIHENTLNRWRRDGDIAGVTLNNTQLYTEDQLRDGLSNNADRRTKDKSIS